MHEEPVVSVCMITYNHEPYISQAIEGVLLQETSFPVELVIGEDCSTDKTREICRQYRSQFPCKIRLYERDKNLGMIGNLIRTLGDCTGKYVAMCEGDDYWEKKDKLAYQVEFLEANAEYSGACSRSKRFIQGEGRFEADSYYKSLSLRERENISTERLLEDFFVYTATMIFRNKLFDPELLRGKCFGDKFIQYLVSTKGDFCFFNREDTVYRVHKAGAMHAVIPNNPYQFFKDHIDFLEFLDGHTNHKFGSSIRFRRSYLEPLMNISNKDTSVSQKIREAFRYFRHRDAKHSLDEYKNLFSLAFPVAKSRIRKFLSRPK